MVEPAVILEPLKGRIITKPADGDYMDFVQIQTFLFQKLSKRREFALVGRPVSVEDIHWVGGSWEFGKKFNSGDYSGATDNLSGVLSKKILKFILSFCSPKFVERCLATFCNAKIDYSRIGMTERDTPWANYYPENWRCNDLGVVEQANGQLMGHILSFPILCIANYISFRYVYWQLEKPAPNVLVNGDDILFCATDEEYSEWNRVVREIGFFPSLGKNLFQADIAQINSVLFCIRYDEIEMFRPFIRSINNVPYVNFGVLTGRGKGKENPFEKKSLTECERELDEFGPEIMSYHANMDTLNYAKTFCNPEVLKSIFHKHRPMMSAFLKELENFPRRFAESMFGRDYHVPSAVVGGHLLPGNSFSQYSCAIGGDLTDNLRKNLRTLKRFPMFFEPETLDKLTEIRLA